jgi:hypothetical protein
MTEAPQIHPSEILLDLIVAFLAPMFLSVSGGDIGFARMAAIETVNAYRARSSVDLIAIAQVIACGLTALGSLSLSMADNLSLSMTLRLRGNAVALNRAAELNRRALKDSLPKTATTTSSATTDDDEAIFEAEVAANLAAAQQATAEAQIRLQIVEPPPTETPDPTDLTTLQLQAMWAAAMTDVAEEFTADLANLSPQERRLATRRVAALSNCANQLLSGDVPPPPRPGDLAAIIRPKPL